MRIRRSKPELAYVVAVSLATVSFAILLVVGFPALLTFRALDHGTTPVGFLYGAAAAAWVGLTLYACITDRVTRGWIAFMTIGWIPALVDALRRRREAG